MKFIITIFFLFGCTQIQAAKLYVGNNKPYKTITEAIHAAKEDDSILVDAGIYHEKNLDQVRGLPRPCIPYSMLCPICACERYPRGISSI